MNKSWARGVGFPYGFRRGNPCDIGQLGVAAKSNLVYTGTQMFCSVWALARLFWPAPFLHLEIAMSKKRDELIQITLKCPPHFGKPLVEWAQAQGTTRSEILREGAKLVIEKLSREKGQEHNLVLS